MSATRLRIEDREGVRWITIDRPEARNALDETTLRELLRAARDIRRDETVRVAVLTGAGDRAFVAGADIRAMERLSPLEAKRFSRLGQKLTQALEDLPVPVLAAVQGFALGGGLELALACDWIVAARSARFGQPEVGLGLVPGFGGTQRLARRVGAARARELVFTGRTIDADEAYRLGLVERVVEDGRLRDEVDAVARELAAKPRVALAQAKAALQVSTEVDLATGLRYENEAFALTFSTEDAREGMRAFLEKRKAAFRGR
ncbi:MAG: crotonase [Candidatus Binatia bacterium]|nr:MAG: crotonase [Candidatus Binatia bacterium]